MSALGASSASACEARYLERVAMFEAKDLEQSGVCNAKMKGMTRMMNMMFMLAFLATLHVHSMAEAM